MHVCASIGLRYRGLIVADHDPEGNIVVDQPSLRDMIGELMV